MAKTRTLRKDRVAGFVRLAILLAVLIATLVTLFSQQKRLIALRAEQQQLQAKLDELTLEEEKRKRMVDFAQTDAFAEQYARDKLGLVKEGDIKFVNPTPAPDPNAKQSEQPQATPSDEPPQTDDPAAEPDSEP